MRVVWLSWKDRCHPLAGGAEKISGELMRRLAADGHDVVLITSGYTGATAEDSIDGYRVIRVGGRYTVYWEAYKLFRAKFSDWPDIVIDECNTMPFFAMLYANSHSKVYLLAHQLCRSIWFYQLPMPFSLLGYCVEPLYLRLLRKTPVLTVSLSTAQDMIRFGFVRENIAVFREGLDIDRLDPSEKHKKFERPTLLSLGSVRPMKRTIDIFLAFEIAKQTWPELQLIIAGSTTGAYGAKLLKAVESSTYRDSIQVVGPVSDAEKIELMRRSHVIAVTSVKEGWGLIVTEAASQGTPAVAYDVDGLRDSVVDGVTGRLVKNGSPTAIAAGLLQLLANDADYQNFRRSALEHSRQYTTDNMYADFKSALNVAT